VVLILHDTIDTKKLVDESLRSCFRRAYRPASLRSLTVRAVSNRQGLLVSSSVLPGSAPDPEPSAVARSSVRAGRRTALDAISRRTWNTPSPALRCRTGVEPSRRLIFRFERHTQSPVAWTARISVNNEDIAKIRVTVRAQLFRLLASRIGDHALCARRIMFDISPFAFMNCTSTPG
jgi:hypothetical protein